MAQLAEITDYLNGLLHVAEIPDYPSAHNGLQLANDGVVHRVGAAVDACLPVIEQAVEAELDLLLVHHGLFWGGVQAITGAYYQKLKRALEHNLAVYSAHIPLDVHESLGNNVGLSEALGFTKTEPFFMWKGIQLGRRISVEDFSREALADRLETVLGSAVHSAPGGPEEVREIGIITGGAGSEVAAVAAEGIDTFVTGEGPHHTYGLAEELGVNLFYAGHYATETFGVRALARQLSEREGLGDPVFIDHPSGL